MSEEAIVQQGVHNYSAADEYVYPSDPVIQDKLEWFKDQKLALMMHWGLYNQLGIVASWALSDVDADWSRRQINWVDDPTEFIEQYYALNKSFNPIRFQPDEWAEMAAENGFKYLILTTKHHDGFCLWDSQYSDYKTTAPDCPFHTHKHADIVKSMFDAFRARGLGIGAYFSKADWHTPYYRTPEIKSVIPSTRGPMYKPSEDPERWEKFVQFTKNQVLELVEDYGDIDILWFDAGWVCAENGQDIRLNEIVDEARKIKPDILSVDRTIGGPYENYITPEMTVPIDPIHVPWESCLTLGVDFTYEYDDVYKTPRQLVQILVDIVAKGGNLALSVSPQPDGRIPLEAMHSILGLGQWLKTYGEAIYGTRPCAPYAKNDVSFTKKGDRVYAIRSYRFSQEPVGAEVFIPYTGTVKQLSFLDSGEVLNYKLVDGGLSVEIPRGRRTGSAPIALVFVID